MFEWIFQNIFPGWAADRAKKKINLNRKKFEEIIIDYPDTIDVSVAIKKIEEDLKNQLTEKKL